MDKVLRVSLSDLLKTNGRTQLGEFVKISFSKESRTTPRNKSTPRDPRWRPAFSATIEIIFYIAYHCSLDMNSFETL